MLFFHSLIRNDLSINQALSEITESKYSEFSFHQKCYNYYTHSKTLATLTKRIETETTVDNQFEGDVTNERRLSNIEAFVCQII